MAPGPVFGIRLIVADRKTDQPAVRVNTNGLTVIERMSHVVQRAWSTTNKCDVGRDCPHPPTHFLRYRGKRFLLACDQHAKAAAEQSGLEIVVKSD